MFALQKTLRHAKMVSIAKEQILGQQKKQIWSLLYRNLKARD
jgi:hypothetical protein